MRVIPLGILLMGIQLFLYGQDAWEKISGPVEKVLVGYDQIEQQPEVYAVFPEKHEIHAYLGTPGNWTRIGGPGKDFVVAEMGQLYGLSEDSKSIWKYSGRGQQWTKIGDAAAGIYGGDDGLFATNPVSKDLLKYDPVANRWTGTGGPGKMFAVGAKGHLYGLAPNGASVWKYDGTGTKWTQIGGPAGKIYAGGNKLYATNPTTGEVFLYLGSPNNWKKIGKPGNLFSVDQQGNLYGLSPNSGQIWEYLAAQDKWVHIGGKAEAIVAGADRQVFSIAPNSKTLWRRTENPFATPAFGLKPALGVREVLTILWDPNRPDHPALPKPVIEKAIFGPDPSVAGYFRENSGNKFEIRNAGISGWHNANKRASHYWAKADQEDLPEDRNGNAILDTGEDLNGNGKLDGPDGILQPDEDKNGNGSLDFDLDGDGWISRHAEKWAEAIGKADPTFNFKKYDFNNNGILEKEELVVLIVIPQNDPFGTERAVASRQYPVNEALVVDGVRIPTIVEAYIGNPASASLVAHELSHILFNAGDMYFNGFQPFAAGPYSLMDQSVSPQHLDPYHKLKLGWVRPRIITPPVLGGPEVILDVETNNEVTVLYNPNRGNKEYFIIENRWKDGLYDKTLPSFGLAVWHVMEDPAVFEHLPVPKNVDPKSWAEWQKQGWARNAIRMIRPIYGPPINWSIWNGNDRGTGYDLLSTDTNPAHATLKWADGSPSGFSIQALPVAGSAMLIKM